MAFGEPVPRPVIDALILRDADRDRDGRLTLAEATAAGPVSFASADANKDNVVGALEVRAWGEAVGGSAQSAPLFAALDRNGDGTASAEEFSRWFADRFAALDKNKDGAVTAKELFEDILPPARPPRPQVLKDELPPGNPR